MTKTVIANKTLPGTGEFSTTPSMADVKIPTKKEWMKWAGKNAIDIPPPTEEQVSEEIHEWRKENDKKYLTPRAVLKAVVHPRPFQTYYYNSAKDSLTAWAKKSKACTLRGAARAAFMRVLDREYNHVDIYDEDDLWVGFIHREKNDRITAVIAINEGE